MMSRAGIARGDVWMIDLSEPPRGREQAGNRPALVVSVNEFNRGPADLVVVLPITTVHKGIPFHVRLDPPSGGVVKSSFIKCEDIRSISRDRLRRYLGTVGAQSLDDVGDRLRILLDL